MSLRWPKIPILMYHRIGERVAASIVPDHYVSRELFERQLKMLRALRYQTIHLSEIAEVLERPCPAARRYAVISFDDGYRSFISDALPTLEKNRMTASVFLVADCIGSSNRWDEIKGDVSEPLMTVKEIQQCLKRGVEFGAHTLSHPDLRFCDTERAREEIFGSRRKLQEMLSCPIEWFSYPYGKQGLRERTLVREAGFAGACATGKSVNTRGTDPFALARINVRATTSSAYLFYKVIKASRRYA
jgi:peptidoglycan/xylan/chitin deacetylase (PgdA/CDA1 family)